MRGHVRATHSKFAWMLCVMAGMIPACTRNPGPKSGEESDMNAQVLEQKIVAKDASAPALAKQLGASA